MTRTATNAPKHAATRWNPAHGWLPRSPARWIEVTGLLIGLLAGFGAALTWAATRGPAQPAGPVMAIAQPPGAVHVSADAEPNPAVLDQEWAAYSDRSTCADWAGGDGVSAIRVSRSQLAWFFADTFLGPARPATGYSHVSGFVHNSVVVQTATGTDSTFVTMTGGGSCGGTDPAEPVRSVVGPPLAPGAPKDRYWDADGTQVGGTIVKFYNRYLPGGVPFIPTGTVMATFPVSQLTSAGHQSAGGLVARPGLIPVPSYVPPAGGTPLIWGAALVRAGDMVYVYGTQAADPSAPDAQLYLARVPAPELTRFTSWRFYAGGGQWAAGQVNARAVQPPGSGLAVSSGFSVIAMGGRYWLIQAGPQSGSTDIDAYPAVTPWGPFDPAEGITLYHNADVGLDAAHDYRIMYEARAEPALSSSHTLVISYNVNSAAVTTGCVSLSAYTNTVVQPRFIAVPTAVFAPGAVPGRFTVTIGPPDYPRIAGRDRSQWFNGWSYQGGCPPVPGLKSAAARPAAGTVMLTWPDDGLGVRYHVYLDGPGENGGRVAATNRDHAMITGLRPGDYSATVVPVNVRDTAGGSATVRFTVP